MEQSVQKLQPLKSPQLQPTSKSRLTLTKDSTIYEKSLYSQNDGNLAAKSGLRNSYF